MNRNNYYLHPKKSNIQTPPAVSQFIYKLLNDKIAKGLILDPCSGQGNLLKPWNISYQGNGYNYHPWSLFGIEIDSQVADKMGSFCHLRTDFFSLTQKDFKFFLPKEISLILCNPHFNGMKPKLAPEIWLDKIIELFGKNVPIVLFAPYNFRLPWKSDSKRLSKFLRGKYPPIASIISLPTKGLWEGVTFHSEILIFNIPNLQPHYFFKKYYE